MSTLTFYPVAGANSPIDGTIQRAVASETFSTIRTSTGTSVQDSTTPDYALLRGSTTPSEYNRMRRYIACFDTSALGASATISSAILSLYGEGQTNGLGNPEIDIVASTPANTNALVNGDYLQTGTTPFSSITYAGWNASGYNAFTLDSNGIANISLTGISKFGARLNWDTDNSFGGVWASGAESRFGFKTADVAGTSTDPKLVVTFTLPGGNPMFFGPAVTVG